MGNIEKNIQFLLRMLIKWTPPGMGMVAATQSLIQQEYFQAVFLFFLTALSSVWVRFSGQFLEEVEREAARRGGSLGQWVFVVGDQFADLFRNELTKTWQTLTSGFEAKYFRRLEYIHRSYETQGLLQDRVLKLVRVFVPLKIAQKSLALISPDLIQAPSEQENLSKQQEIGDILALMEKDPSLRHFAILGAPGSGKTTLLRYLTLTYVTRTQRALHPRAPRWIPVLLYLRDIYKTVVRKPEITLAELITQWVEQLAISDTLSVPQGWFANKLSKNQCLVMLDGLDEVADQQERQQVSRWVDVQMARYPELPILLTSRPFGYKTAQLRATVTVLEVQPFGLGQIQQFLHNWSLYTEIMSQQQDDPGIEEAARSQAEDLLQRITSSPSLAAMAVNPMLLTMIATLHWRGGFLPKRRVELYREICQILLEKRLRAKGISDLLEGFSASQKQSLLQAIALKMMEDKTRSFTLDQIQPKIEIELTRLSGNQISFEQLIQQIKDVSGLLVAGEIEGVYKFAHISFQEYLASVEIKETNSESLLLELFKDPDRLFWWAETIRLYAGQADATNLILIALETSTTDSLNLAVDCLEEAYKVSEEARNMLSRRLSSNVIEDILIQVHDGTSGFFKGKEKTLMLDLINTSGHPVEFCLELDSSPKYDVTSLIPGNENIRLNPKENRALEYSLVTLASGPMPLQLKVNGKIYRPAIEIYSTEQNPYYYGPPIRKPLNFLGREKELNKLWNNATNDAGLHTMLIGEQRSGKTSLLYQIQRMAKTPYLPIYISLAGIGRDEKVALNWLLAQIINEINNSFIITRNGNEMGSPRELIYNSDFTRELRQIADEVKKRRDGTIIILLLDEAHSMRRIDITFQETLREAFNQLVQDIRVVLACYYNFFDDMRTSSSPLYNIFDYIFLEPFQGHELDLLITEPAKRFGYCFEARAVDTIKAMSGGHPYYCQFLCGKCFWLATNSSRQTIVVDDVNSAYHEVLKSDKEKFKAGYWNNLTVEEVSMIEKILDHASIFDSGEIVKKLENKHIIAESNGSYNFTSRLFEDWLIQLIKAKGLPGNSKRVSH